MKTPSYLDAKKLTHISVGAIEPNPSQPRRVFEPEALSELADSIRQFGILQPLTVRKLPSGVFQLVAGERRLRAARQAGLDKVPCILVNVDERDSGLLALVENLQRRDLDFIEEAEGLRALIRSYGIRQEDAARYIGKSQSAVANKLRLLKLSPEVLALLREKGLTERHARALLRLPTEDAQLETLAVVLENDLTVARTEAYIDALLAGGQAGQAARKPQKRTRFFVLKDVRIFLNTITRGLGIMQRSGVDAVCDQTEANGELILTIRIPRAAKSS